MIRSTNDFNKISKRNIFEPKVLFRRGKAYTVPQKVFAYAILFIIVHEAFSCHLVIFSYHQSTLLENTCMCKYFL